MSVEALTALIGGVFCVVLIVGLWWIDRKCTEAFSQPLFRDYAAKPKREYEINNCSDGKGDLGPWSKKTAKIEEIRIGGKKGRRV